jgi:hypothetical protein
LEKVSDIKRVGENKDNEDILLMNASGSHCTWIFSLLKDIED